MSDLEQYAKEHQVPIMMDGGLKFLLEKLQEKQCLSFLELGTAIALIIVALFLGAVIGVAVLFFVPFFKNKK